MKVVQIAITVDNLDRARTFYRDTLRLAHLFDAPGMAFFDCNGIRVLLGTAEKPEPRGGTIVYLGVDDIAAEHARLVEQGVEFVQEPHVVHRTADTELWLAFFRDSENNVIALLEMRGMERRSGR